MLDIFGFQMDISPLRNISTYISILSLMVSVVVLFVALRTREDSFFFKKMEVFQKSELSPDNFQGSLSVMGFDKKQIEEDGLSIEELLYFNVLLNAVEIQQNHGRIRRMKSIFCMNYSNLQFSRKVEIAAKRDKKTPFFPEGSLMGYMFRTKKFLVAWEKYLDKYWGKHKDATKTAVLIAAHLKNTYQ